MHLVIDAGNTHVKLALFNKSGKRYGSIKLIDFDYKLLTNYIQSISKIESTIYCSVRSDDGRFIKFLQSNYPTHVLDIKSRLPFVNKYKTPNTLGKDRIANIAAASQLAGNVLVVDAGTCIKFDLLEKNKSYCGGSIHPGIRMRYKALNHFTGKLPLIEFIPKKINTNKLIGTSTEACLNTGVELAIILEVEAIIARYKQKFPNLITIITGGDLRFFSQQINFTFAARDFTLQGLYQILKLNS
ncbi:MAG: type III pantothenate kinase [Bacteroidetes bacterium]|nr:type III pantothenate kinase [Bacteroidota bacterium]